MRYGSHRSPERSCPTESIKHKQQPDPAFNQIVSSAASTHKIDFFDSIDPSRTLT
jgi:hypothetical protein